MSVQGVGSQTRLRDGGFERQRAEGVSGHWTKGATREDRSKRFGVAGGLGTLLPLKLFGSLALATPHPSSPIGLKGTPLDRGAYPARLAMGVWAGDDPLSRGSALKPHRVWETGGCER